MQDISLEKLQKMKKALPHGAISRIAKKTGYTHTSVNDVLKGKFKNSKIFQAVTEEIGTVYTNLLLTSN